MTHIPISHLPLSGEGTEGITIMKKVYIEPTLKIEETQGVSNMLVGSGDTEENIFDMNGTNVSGRDALTKENAGTLWNSTESIWDKGW